MAFPGLEAWFNSSDHLPPHFHVEKVGHWEVRVFFLEGPAAMIEVKWGRGPSGKEKRLISTEAAAMRLELLAEWSLKVARE